MVSLRNDLRTLRTSKLDHRDNGSCVTAGANGSVQRGCLHVDYKTFPVMLCHCRELCHQK